MKVFAVRLHDGQDLFLEIQHIAKQHSITAGVILSAVGGLGKTKIRVPVIDGNLKYIYPVNVEIDALHGTVSSNGSHLHVIVSDVNGLVAGGHIKEGCYVRNTCELVIGIIDSITFERKPDSKTGYDELKIS